MLDLLEWYLSLRGYTYCRLDGSTNVSPAAHESPGCPAAGATVCLSVAACLDALLAFKAPHQSLYMQYLPVMALSLLRILTCEHMHTLALTHTQPVSFTTNPPCTISPTTADA